MPRVKSSGHTSAPQARFWGLASQHTRVTHTQPRLPSSSGHSSHSGHTGRLQRPPSSGHTACMLKLNPDRNEDYMYPDTVSSALHAQIRPPTQGLHGLLSSCTVEQHCCSDVTATALVRPEDAAQGMDLDTDATIMSDTLIAAAVCSRGVPRPVPRWKPPCTRYCTIEFSSAASDLWCVGTASRA